MIRFFSQFYHENLLIELKLISKDAELTESLFATILIRNVKRIAAISNWSFANDCAVAAIYGQVCIHLSSMILYL